VDQHGLIPLKEDLPPLFVLSSAGVFFVEGFGELKEFCLRGEADANYGE